MKLGQRLRELRRERGLVLDELSALCGLSKPYLSDLERGISNPSLSTLEQIAGGYGLSVLALLAGVDFMGGATPGSLPLALAELLADPKYGPLITPEWAALLARLEYRGKRPRVAADYLELFLHLRRVVG